MIRFLIITIFFTIFGYKLINNKNLEISKKIEKFFLLSFFTSLFKIEKIQISGIENIKERTILKSLNIDPEDGVVRISLTHYNSKNEVDKLIFLGMPEYESAKEKYPKYNTL